MKRSEMYIEKLSKTFKLSPATTKTIYEAVNKYDWKCFCSYMADYDQPQERVAAKKELDRFKNFYSENFQKVINNVQDFMKSDEEYDIHKMDEEVEGQ